MDDFGLGALIALIYLCLIVAAVSVLGLIALGCLILAGVV